MKPLASDQVERANEHERRQLTLAADVASSAVLLGLVAVATAVVVLPIALAVGLIL